ncbi:hypothetical protein BDL97_18G090800 [Sphagnum fallax]|nr:hypothetical protein BDL97_18G090800 [Sphagnum fallax]KAH8934585.1 hypothetical protein BDL97_18G090800 [Sphagnum fallax]
MARAWWSGSLSPAMVLCTSSMVSYLPIGRSPLSLHTMSTLGMQVLPTSHWRSISLRRYGDYPGRMRARAVAVDSDFPEKRDLEQQMEQLSSRSTHEQADSPVGTALTSVLPGFKFLHATAVVHPDAVLGEEGDECSLYIGNNNDIREYVSIHRSSKPNDDTVIGDDNLIMGSCHIAHDCRLGNHNILANGTLLGGHVMVKDYVHTGGAVAVHQFCHIDSYSFLAGGSMVDRDVPMYMMVSGDRAELRGLNLEGLRRCGFSDLEVKSIRRTYQKLFMNSDTEAGGLEDRLATLELNEELANVPAVVSMLKSVRNCFGEKRRGICKFRHWSSV